MRKAWLAVATLVLVAACNDHKKELDASMADQQRISAEKDSVMNEMMATTQLIDSINMELANARVGVTAVNASEGNTKASERAAVLARVKDAMARLTDAQEALEKSKARLAAMTKKDKRLMAQIDRYQQTIADLKTTTARQQTELQAIIDSQKVEIASLHTNLDTATAQNQRLTTEKQAVIDTMNTVYVLAGKKDSLKKMGVVVDEGSKFLFFGGHQMMPARQLNPQLFTVYNRLRDSVIPLPDSQKSYKIVSRQSPEFLASGMMKDGKVKGAELRIAEPVQFWAPSRYLILVEQ
jgi:myosin heavy subunit